MKPVLCFDVGDTLSKFHANKSLQRELSRITNIEEDIIKKILKTELSRRKISLDEFILYMVKRLQLEDSCALLMRNSVKECITTHELYDDTVSTLQILRERGYTIVFASNTLSFRYKPLQELGLEGLYSHAIYSFEYGFVKPEKEFYRQIEKVVGVTNKNMVMIGDSLKSDVLGAINAGWRAILVNRKGVPVPSSISQIVSLEELLQIFL